MWSRLVEASRFKQPIIRCQREQAVKPAELAGAPGKDWESGRPACLARPLRIIDSPQQRLTLDAVADPKKRRRSAPNLSAFQPVLRDFAFVVTTDVTADAVLRAARQADRTLIAAVRLFDLYEGDKLAHGCKSLGVEVTLQPSDHTLTDAEIDAVSTKIVTAVAKATGAELR